MIKEADEVLSKGRITLQPGEMQKVSPFTPQAGHDLILKCEARFTHLPDSVPCWTVSYDVPVELDLNDYSFLD